MAKSVTLKNSNGDTLYPVTDASLINGSLQASQIPANAITTDRISDGAVTTAKIADGAVTAAKVVGGETASTLAGGALVEVIGTTSGSSANYAWKFADGRLICFQRYSWSGVNINSAWGGCYSAQVMTPVNYVVPFIASPIVAATPDHSANGANFWLSSNVERGVAALTHPPAYQIIRPTSSNGSAASIDIVAYGFWK